MRRPRPRRGRGRCLGPRRCSGWPPAAAGVGGGRAFRCKVLHPSSESELREILDSRRGGSVRAGGTLHSFDTSCSTDGLLLRLDRFRTLQLEPEGSSVRIGAGLVLREVEAFLQNFGLTLPVPLTTTTQNVIGAMCHATRGAGGHCLAEHCTEVRITSRAGAKPASTSTLRGQDQHYAACSLGVLGVVSEVVLKVVPDYNLSETMRFADDFAEAMQILLASPRTYIFLWPYVWQYMIQQRDEVGIDEPVRKSTHEDIVTDLISIGTINLLAELDKLSGNSLTILGHAYKVIRKVSPERATTVGRAVNIVDQKFVNFMSANLQFEVLMPQAKVGDAVKLLELVVELFAGTQSYADITQPWAKRLQAAGLWDCVMTYFGTCVFNVLTYMRLTYADINCLMSPTYEEKKTTPGNGSWYCGFNVEYYTPTYPEQFHSFGDVLLPLLLEFCDARLHWGKYFPLDDGLLQRNCSRHLGMQRFLEARERLDPERQFLNAHYAKALGLESQSPGLEYIHSQSSILSWSTVTSSIPLSRVTPTQESIGLIRCQRSSYIDLTNAEKAHSTARMSL